MVSMNGMLPLSPPAFMHLVYLGIKQGCNSLHASYPI